MVFGVMCRTRLGILSTFGFTPRIFVASKQPSTAPLTGEVVPTRGVQGTGNRPRIFYAPSFMPELFVQGCSSLDMHVVVPRP